MRSLVSVFLFFITLIVSGQSNSIGQIRVITTSVPFLTVPTNAYQKSRGEVGVVSDDFHVESAYYSNAALLATGRRYVQANATILPWLPTLVRGMFLYDASCSIGLTAKSAIGLQYQGFSVPMTSYLDSKTFLVNDNRFQINYAQRFGKRLAVGMSFKYVRSNLNPDYQGNVFAGDLGVNYKYKKPISSTANAQYAFGGGVNNLGNKINYSSAQYLNFIPANLQAGASAELNNQVGKSFFFVDISYQFTKLLVPTPPLYFMDKSGADSLDANGMRVIAKGLDPNVGTLTGAIHSFYDSPAGIQEEIKEYAQQFAFSQGIRWNDTLAITFRQGVFYESRDKGNRKYFSVGLGVEVFRFRLEYAFLRPFFFDPTSLRNGGPLYYSALINTHTATLTYLFSAKN